MLRQAHPGFLVSSTSDRIHLPWLQSSAELYTALQDLARPPDVLVSNWFKAHPALGRRDRAWVSDVVFGMLRKHHRLELLAPVRLSALERVVLHVLLERPDAPLPDRLETILPPGITASLRRAAARLPEVLEASDWPTRMALQYGGAPWMAEQWREQLGEEEAELAAKAFGQRAPLTVRVNTNRTKRGIVQASLAAEGVEATFTKYSPWGLHLPEGTRVDQLKAFADGRIEVQDEGSQLIALLCRPRAGDRVVDACAGAGGKSLALQAMAPDATILCLDRDESRMRSLPERARRAGAKLERSTWAAFAAKPRPADVVLVDAPCSGLGTLRRQPDVRRFEHDVLDKYASQQRILLQQAAGWVKLGGRLVYATCSTSVIENEGVADAFEASRPEFVRLNAGNELAAAGAPGFEGSTLRLWPHRQGSDGFFAVVWERRS